MAAMCSVCSECHVPAMCISATARQWAALSGVSSWSGPSSWNVKRQNVPSFVTGRGRLASSVVPVRAVSLVEKLEETFPLFLPTDVEKLQERAARDMAARIQQLPVQTSLCADPILTSCVSPSVAHKDWPQLMLLHGFDSSCLEWRRIFPLLEKAGLRPWAIDILGSGFSNTAKGISSFGVAAKREHLYEFWKTHIGEPVILIGASLGGATALDFTLVHPDAVHKLVLINAQGYAEGIGEKDALPKYLAYIGAAVLKSVPLRAYANTLVFSKLSAEILFDSMRVGRLHCLMPGWADALVDFMRSGGYNVSAHVKEVQKDTLILWGEKDKILPKEYPEMFKTDLQKSVLHYIPDSGHIPHVEKPEVVSALVSDFVKN